MDKYSETELSPPLATEWQRRLFIALRPHHWILNGFVYVAIIFSGHLFHFDLFVRATLLTLAFCLATSSMALADNLIFLPRAGQQEVNLLGGPRLIWLALMAILGLASLALTIALDRGTEILMLFFWLQQLVYLLYVKQIVLFHAMLLALGVILRVMAGALVVRVYQLSPWVYLCISLFALFLALGRTRHQLTQLTGEGPHLPSVVSQYTLPFLDQLIGLVITASLIAYTLYSFQAETALAGGRMLLTVPFVFYCMARYLYLIHVHKRGGAADELLLQDRPLLIASLLWMFAVVLLIYGSW